MRIFENKELQQNFEWGVGIGKAMFDESYPLQETLDFVEELFQKKHKEFSPEMQAAIKEELEYFFCL